MVLLRQAADSSIFRDDLLRACENNLAYDPQCESERSGYLARLISATGDQEAFFSALLPRLLETPDDQEALNHPQIFSVLALLAAECSDLDGATLRETFAKLGDEDRLDCMDALVKLDGLPAFLDCATLLAQHLDADGWRASTLLDAIRAREGSGIDRTLSELRQRQPILERLLAYVEAEDTPSPRQAEAYDFTDIRSRLLRGTMPERSGLWARQLTDAEWRLLGEDLTTRIDEKRAAHYLQLFGRRPFPGDPENLIRWIDSQAPRVAWLAVNALGRVQSSVVRAIALQRIEAGHASGVRLLKANFEPGDFSRMEPVLDATVEAEAAHDLGLSVLDLVGANDYPLEARASLLLLYQRTPCSMCRNGAASGLVKIGQVPVWMAEECRFDADPDTASLFVNHVGMEKS